MKLSQDHLEHLEYELEDNGKGSVFVRYNIWEWEEVGSDAYVLRCDIQSHLESVFFRDVQVLIFESRRALGKVFECSFVEGETNNDPDEDGGRPKKPKSPERPAPSAKKFELAA